MVETTELPILSGNDWLQFVDNQEQGEEIAAPLGMLPFIKGAVTVLGAETAVGKTALGLQCFRYAVDNSLHAGYLTLEMSPALLFKRFHPQFGSQDVCREWISTMGNAEVSLSYLDFPEVEKIIREKKFDFVVIDHIHELPFDGHEDLARKVKRIASLAPETNTAIYMLSQMKQPDLEFGRKEPQLYDYSWTKAIPEVASIAQVLWKPSDDAELRLSTLKNRFGALPGDIKLNLNKSTITFEKAW